MERVNRAGIGAEGVVGGLWIRGSTDEVEMVAMRVRVLEGVSDESEEAELRGWRGMLMGGVVAVGAVERRTWLVVESDECPS